MSHPLRVLIVEDSEKDSTLVVRQLTKAGFEAVWERVDTREGMAAALAGKIWDLVIADYNLPQFQAPDALALLKAGGHDIPFIVVSGSMGEETAVSMMRAGAHDYLMKDNLARLGPAVHRELEECRTRIEKRLAEERVRASLREKEVLLSEIHHRVKNNLQIVGSMLNMQAERSADPLLLANFKEAQNRIKSIAIVHEKLYHSSDLSNIDLSEYVQDLAENLVRTLSDGSIALTLDVDKVPLSIDLAIPCGLIINELVSNALKYAFPEARKGTVSVSLKAHNTGRLLLIVKDDGIGIPEHATTTNVGTLGMTLVTILVEQIDGTMEIRGGQGTTVRIDFPRLRR